MTSADQLKRLLRSHLAGDDERFRATALEIAAECSANGDAPLAAELRALLAQPGDPAVPDPADPGTALRETERKYHVLFDLSAVPAAFLKLPDVVIVDANRALEELTGYSKQEMLGRTAVELGLSTRESRARSVSEFEQRGSLRGAVVRIRTKAGAERTVVLNTNPLRLHDGHYGITTMIDVTDQLRAEEESRCLNRELERRVSERTAQLEEVNRELEAFSYSVSHDLRAPLRHMRGYAEMLGRELGTVSDKARSHLHRISDASREMGQLVDDLLEFSRMGRTAMREAAVDLGAVVHSALRGLGPADGRTIDWTIPALPVVTGDAALLRQVFANLLGNAVKYTRPRNPAAIEIGCAGQEDGLVVLFVRDNGVGFDPQYAGKLFGVFQRLHRADEFEGTGIGLANVRRIVARHGGRTWADGRPGEGATFYFTLKPAPPASE